MVYHRTLASVQRTQHRNPIRVALREYQTLRHTSRVAPHYTARVGRGLSIRCCLTQRPTSVSQQKKTLARLFRNFSPTQWKICITFSQKRRVLNPSLPLELHLLCKYVNTTKSPPPLCMYVSISQNIFLKKLD